MPPLHCAIFVIFGYLLFLSSGLWNGSGFQRILITTCSDPLTKTIRFATFKLKLFILLIKNLVISDISVGGVLKAKSFRPADDDDDDSDDDFSDDEDLQSPIDEVDPFIFFMDTAKGKLQMHFFFNGS